MHCREVSFCLLVHVELRGAVNPRTNRLRNQPVMARPCEAMVGSASLARSPIRGSGGSPEGAATLRYHVGRPLWPSLLLSQG